MMATRWTNRPPGTLGPYWYREHLRSGKVQVYVVVVSSNGRMYGRAVSSHHSTINRAICYSEGQWSDAPIPEPEEG